MKATNYNIAIIEGDLDVLPMIDEVTIAIPVEEDGFPDSKNGMFWLDNMHFKICADGRNGVEEITGAKLNELEKKPMILTKGCFAMQKGSEWCLDGLHYNVNLAYALVEAGVLKYQFAQTLFEAP
tara:strand:+ start:96 stop:470 length:375 start_codon:yes stop_codon:yes gene_type:complete